MVLFAPIVQAVAVTGMESPPRLRAILLTTLGSRSYALSPVLRWKHLKYTGSSASSENDVKKTNGKSRELRVVPDQLLFSSGKCTTDGYQLGALRPICHIGCPEF
ncbi:hypothetical protein EDB86DRAFT_215324 [Lactarius hatsudake]|nr:hypothetical protein EDB86DRAFT_215324 [Lactarius hatsudake]